MEIYVQATMGVCMQFTDAEGNRQEASVVISPLKVTANEEGTKLQIQTGCNLWKSCHNESCYYSIASRDRKRS